MRVIKKKSGETKPRLSMVFLDWSVRESFHLLHYLRQQTVGRDLFEVIVIEYYDHASDKIRELGDAVDTWVLLEMPKSCYYHKHLIYNAGLIFSQGDILLFGDSDAMVRPAFVETILKNFDRDPLIVYHMDQFRNVRRDLYPFNYPSFEEVLGEGCINNAGGKTTGIVDEIDPMHSRNYGACMCARREDVIAIGGADEDLTYLGHICGPYEMTFRLMNFGRRLVWETEEYMYHTWHPGSDGTDDYFGPQDGLHMSTTAFQALRSGRIRPLKESEAIRRLHTGHQAGSPENITASVIDPSYVDAFSRARLGGGGTSHPSALRPPAPRELWGSYRGYDVYSIQGKFYGVPPQMGAVNPADPAWRNDRRVIQASTFSAIQSTVDLWEARVLEETKSGGSIYSVGNRFAIVPRDLNPPAFYDPLWRGDARIIWADSLAAVRKRANGMDATGNQEQVMEGQTKDEQIQQELALLKARLAAFEKSTNPAAFIAMRLEIKGELASLGERVSAVEHDVKAIYESRIWRALVKAAGIFQPGRPSRRVAVDPESTKTGS